MNRFSYQFGRWATGYQYIEKALERGLADPEVRGIALVVHSPGGEAAGCFECGEKIEAARGKKPVVAFIADVGHSAAYMVAAGAKEIVATRSASLGSIGVVATHQDFSKMLEQVGLKITLIFEGAHKVDGNPYEPLPESVRARYHARITKSFERFCSLVASMRGLSVEAVKNMESLTYDSQEAVDKGLANRVGSLEEELVNFASNAAREEDDDMPEGNSAASFTQAQMDAAVAEARATAFAEGQKAARERMTAILSSDEAKDRPKTALAMALKSGDDAESVKALLADMPKEAAAAAPAATTAKSPFDTAMDATGNPQVGANPTNDGTQQASTVDSIFASAGFAPVPARQ